MLPILLEFGFLKIYTFGVFLVLAFFWAMYYLWRNIQLTAFKEEEVFDGLFIALIGAIIVGRLFHVFFHFQDFGFSFLKIILINGFPGFSLWGGIIGFFIFLFFFAKSRKIEYAEIVDYFIPPVLLGMAIGKLGAFFAGVEVGSQTSFPLALTFAVAEGTRHLTPLYESLMLFLAVFFAHRILFAIRRDVLSRGFLLLFFFWSVSLVYLSLDWIRGERTILMGYSVYGVLSGMILLTLTLYMIYYFRGPILQNTIGKFQKKSK
ncbi:MAG: prolipoprotein diacylglyceryl transferase [Patescibacteria group bacterium]|nr:prolipoprotein diacylglyceryl transferase [Patescibacteria group bacterium]